MASCIRAPNGKLVKTSRHDTHELNLTWLNSSDCSTLLRMQKRTVQRGRPQGTTRYEAEPALAFGKAVRAFRLDQGVAQEELAALAGIERSHMGKIERGEHLPSRSEEHTSELQSPLHISYAVFCLKK